MDWCWILLIIVVIFLIIILACCRIAGLCAQDERRERDIIRVRFIIEETDDQKAESGE